MGRFSSDLIKVGEDAVESVPVTSLKHHSESQIRDYSALASLYLYYGLPVRAEYTLRQIVKLRTESVNFGPGHAETLMHLKLLRKSLKMQHKYKSASAITKRITRAGELPWLIPFSFYKETLPQWICYDVCVFFY